MKKMIFFAAIFGSMLMGETMNAQTVKRFDRRVQRGWNDGSLTIQERKQINFLKAQLQRDTRMAKADGIITMRERRILEQDERALNRAIYMNRHDRQVARR